MAFRHTRDLIEAKIVELEALVPFKVSFPMIWAFGKIFPRKLSLWNKYPQMAFYICRRPHWIKIESNFGLFFVFSGCWFSGIGSRISELLMCRKFNFNLRCLLDLSSTSLEQNLRLKYLGYLPFTSTSFLYAVWLPHVKVMAITEETVSFTRRESLCLDYQFLNQNWLGASQKHWRISTLS